MLRWQWNRKMKQQEFVSFLFSLDLKSTKNLRDLRIFRHLKKIISLEFMHPFFSYENAHTEIRRFYIITLWAVQTLINVVSLYSREDRYLWLITQNEKSLDDDNHCQSNNKDRFSPSAPSMQFITGETRGGGDNTTRVQVITKGGNLDIWWEQLFLSFVGNRKWKA